MDLKQLSYFVRVAELGSFTKAAQLLDTTQPALSRLIRMLEVDLRQTLLVRNGRGAVPTEAGQVLLEHGRGILHQVQRAREDLGTVRGGLAGRVAIGLPPSLARVFAVPLTVLLLAFIMGLQNAVVTKMSSAQIRTTHMTGVITDLGMEMGKMLYWNRSGTPAAAQVRANHVRMRLYASLLAMFTSGGVVGAAGFKYIGFIWVVPLAALILALSLPPLAGDVERLRRLWRVRR